RALSQEALFIVTNAPNEHIRVRYLHMLPRQFNSDGMVSGRLVREGEVIGKVGNFFRRERGTTYHLHFDIQVPTKYGWVFVNPYMTLIASYERLIQARGRELQEPEIQEDVPTASIPLLPRPRPNLEEPTAAAKPTETAVKSAPDDLDTRMRRHERAVRLSPVKASLPADAGRRSGGMEYIGFGAGQLRPMGRGISRPSTRTGNIRRHVQSSYGQYQAHHDGF